MKHNPFGELNNMISPIEARRFINFPLKLVVLHHNGGIMPVTALVEKHTEDNWANCYD